MFYSLLISLALASTPPSASAQAAKCSTPAILDSQVNVWKSRALHATSLYRLKVDQAVAAIRDEELKGPALKVAGYGTFTWMSVA